MKIVEIIFTRNEGELLEQNIDFHRRMGVDFFIITDNSSTDGTSKILSKFKSVGLVEFFTDRKIMAQKENMDRMALLAKNKYNADWILVSDTDEFWYCSSGLKDFLNNIPDDINTLKVLRYQHFPTEKDNNFKAKIYQRLLYRENGKDLGFDTGVGSGKDNFARKKILFKPVAEDVDILIGNHSVHFPGRKVIDINVREFIIHEFPVRSYKEFREKVVRARNVFVENNTFEKNVTHWRTWIDLLNNRQLEDFYYKNIFFNKERLKSALDDGRIVFDSSLAEID